MKHHPPFLLSESSVHLLFCFYIASMHSIYLLIWIQIMLQLLCVLSCIVLLMFVTAEAAAVAAIALKDCNVAESKERLTKTGFST